MKISDVLIGWYLKHKRFLPWRNTNDPYFIWISEIILQQTRVSQGLDYYLRFIEKFPNIESLANAHVNDVLKTWQGLGYYTRARNIHIAAKEILSDYNGIFPQSSAELIKLKGIGKYTSAAIASICFNEKIPVVDGNVMRWISRMNGFNFPVSSEKLRRIVFDKATEYMNEHSPRDFNQAMMEFGALYCVPSNPDCKKCPFAHVCFAFQNDKVSILPTKVVHKKQAKRYFNYIVITDKKRVFLTKRPPNDIWNGLFEFPLIETNVSISKKNLFACKEFVDIIGNQLYSVKDFCKIKHVLSHQIIYANFYIIEVRNIKNISINNADIIDIKHVKNYPVSRLIEKFIEIELKI